jgi:predicted secreted hydrolase
MAHLALSDVARGRFYAYERFSRDAAGLAGASGDPFRVFLEDWSAAGSGPEGMTMHLRAAEGEVALDLILESQKPPALQGNQGLSQKGPTPGNASFYYSLTRMLTTGTIRVDGQTYAVGGLSWMDHEWGTSALEAGAVGWDWFSLQLDDGYDLMYAQVRTPTSVSYSFGSLVDPAGRVTPLDPAEVQLEVLATWRSPASQALYPARWRLSVPGLALRLELEPRLANQELPVSVVYWEGAVRIQGSRQGQPVTGSGFVELTGYATGRGGAPGAR